MGQISGGEECPRNHYRAPDPNSNVTVNPNPKQVADIGGDGMPGYVACHPSLPRSRERQTIQRCADGEISGPPNGQKYVTVRRNVHVL